MVDNNSLQGKSVVVTGAIQRVEAAIGAFRAGQPVVVMDARCSLVAVAATVTGTVRVTQ